MRTRRTRNRASRLAALLLAAAPAARPARALEAPDPVRLLDAALAAPETPYQGRVVVTQWYGKQTHAEEMRVFVLPPDKVRREFLAPDGSVARLSISDGDVESVRLVRSGRTVRGNAVPSDEKVLSTDAERGALLANYALSSSTGETVAGRKTWRLTIEPRIPGKPWQTLWLDRDTSVVLRSRRALPKRPFASSAQFVSFEPRPSLDEALFRMDPATDAVIEARGLAPRFLTREQLDREAGGGARMPESLPGGFVFESGDVFPVGKSRVRHARYTDGLTVISLFQTDRPVRLPRGGVLPSGSPPLPGPVRASRAGNLIQWRVGARHYTLMGDVSRELVAQIVKNLR